MTLKIFFRKSLSAVRQELARSDLCDHSQFPPFDSILALAEFHAQNNKSNEAISTFLLCLVHLGLLLS